MNETEALERMVPPGRRRPGKFRDGVVQIHVTRSCDKSCFGCSQGSNLRGKMSFITPEHFEQAVLSLRGYFGVVGVFGGNPAIHPRFEELCEILRKHVPFNQRGLWCNSPLGKASEMRRTFDPSISNLNVHLDRDAYDEFKRDWPECNPVGLTTDSRHAPTLVAMKDVLKKPCNGCDGKGYTEDGRFGTSTITFSQCGVCNGAKQVYDEEQAWSLISNCDINQHWSAMIGVFRGQLRAWFCEVAGAQSILHQDEPEYPDTGVRWDANDPEVCWTYNHRGEKWMCVKGPWWQLPMVSFREQVRKHCHECSIPLKGYGELAQSESGVEQVSQTHAGVYKPKRLGRQVQVVTELVQLGTGRIAKATDYLGNAKK